MDIELKEYQTFLKKVNIEFQNDISLQEINKYNKLNKKFQEKILKTNTLNNIIYFIFKNNINKIIRLLNIQKIKNTRIILTGQAIADLIYYYINIKEDYESSDFSKMINILNDNINDIDMFILAEDNELNDILKKRKDYDFEDEYFQILKESKITTDIYYQDFFTKLNFIHVNNKLLSINKNTGNSIKDFLYLSLLSQFDINSVQAGIVIDIKELKKMFQGKLDNNIFTAKLLYTRNYLEMFISEKHDENNFEIKQVKPGLNIRKIENLKRFIKKSMENFYQDKFDMLYLIKIFLVLEELGNIIKNTDLNYTDIYIVEEYLKTRNELVKLFFDNYEILKDYFSIKLKTQLDEKEKNLIEIIEENRHLNDVCAYYIPVEIKFNLNKENEKFKKKIKYILNEFLEIKNEKAIVSVINDFNFLDLANKILHLMEMKNYDKMSKLKKTLKKENLNYKLAFFYFIVYEEELLNEPIFKLTKFFKYIDKYYSTMYYNLLINNLPNKLEFYNIILELDNYLINEEKINNLLEFKRIKKFINRNNKEKIKKFIRTVLKFRVCSLGDYETGIGVYIVYSIIYSNLKLNNGEKTNNLYSFIKEKFFTSYYQNICLNITKNFFLPEDKKLKNKNITIKNDKFVLKEITDNFELEYLMQINNSFYIYKNDINDLKLFLFEITLLNNNHSFLITVFLNNEGKYIFKTNVDKFDLDNRIYIMEDYKLNDIEYNKLNLEDRKLLDEAIEIILKRLNSKYNILSI